MNRHKTSKFVSRCLKSIFSQIVVWWWFTKLQDKKHLKQIQIYRGFLKWWYPTTMGFPTKNHHVGVFWVPPFKETPISTIPSKQTSSHVLPSTVENMCSPDWVWSQRSRSSLGQDDHHGLYLTWKDSSLGLQIWAFTKPLADIPSLKLTFSHLKMDGWNMIVSFWDGLFSGANC